MEYLIVKWLHVISATLLFGTGIGSAFHLLLASVAAQPQAVAVVSRQVVWADWLFTATTAVLQPLSGFWMLHLLGLPWRTPWVLWSLLLYALAIACWIPVVVLQIRMHRLAEAAVRQGTPLAGAYGVCLRAWVLLGVPAFIAFVLVFWLMVAKPAWPLPFAL